MKQTTNSVVMVEPVNFSFNEDAAETNRFQKKIDLPQEEIQALALAEFSALKEELEKEGVEVIVIQDTLDPITPDSIFPNNRISTYTNGKVMIHPMKPLNRRKERENLDLLKDKLTTDYGYNVQEILSLTHHESISEEETMALEGTGSLLLDRVNKVAYVAISPRSNDQVLDEYCEMVGYNKVAFHAINPKVSEDEDQRIYHTNVMLCIGEDFAVICSESIPNEDERKMVLESLTKSGHEIIDISLDQMSSHFAGNMLAVKNNKDEALLVMSEAAKSSLTEAQITQIESKTRIVSAAIPTIEEIGGGSARCMLLENFLQKNEVE